MYKHQTNNLLNSTVLLFNIDGKLFKIDEVRFLTYGCPSYTKIKKADPYSGICED
jgi:hypothetical protein